MDEAASVQAARMRARRRLIGAAVLVGVGIIGFPLLFETQPRPIAVDIPIEISARDGVPPLKLPPEKGSAVNATRGAGAVVAEAEPPVESAPPAPTPAVPVEAALPARPAAPAADVQAEAQRAQALLDGKPVAVAPAVAAAAPAASVPKAPRFVVQAGAYSDAATLREARQKVEKLGLKTYTQVIQTDAGPRTRVRVGPFGTREEADQAAARIKTSGLAANVLSL
jgi:DedD protein